MEAIGRQMRRLYLKNNRAEIVLWFSIRIVASIEIQIIKNE